MEKDFKKLRKDFFLIVGITLVLWGVIFKVISLIS